MNKLQAAFTKFPRVGHSPTESAIKHRPNSVLEVRGNVYARIGGVLSDAQRERYLNAASTLTAAYNKYNGDTECILQELRKR